MLGNYTEPFYAHEFTALGGGSLAENKEVIDAALASIEPPLSLPVRTQIALGGAALFVEFAGLPSADDVAAVRGRIPTIVGVATTSEPIAVEALAVVDNPSTDLVTVIDVTTPPRDGGTYQILLDSQIGMAATVADAGARVLATFSLIRGGNVIAVRPYEHSWDRAQPQLFSPNITFDCVAGDQVRVQLQFQRIGVAATARLSAARVTIDQLAPANG
jgi:hypothetical protein